MPNRILRDWTDSFKFDGISPSAEVLFNRLIMKADDFGRYHAHPQLIKSGCFPLAEDLHAHAVAAWLTELSDRRLIFCYQAGGRDLLAIINFKQRLRHDVSPKFPAPDGKPERWIVTDKPSDNCEPPPTAAGRRLGGGVVVAEADGEVGNHPALAFTKVTVDKSIPSPAPAPVWVQRDYAEIPTEEQALAQTATAGIPPDFARYVHADWASRNGKDGSGSVVAWLPYVTKRWTREQVEWRGGTHRGRKNAAKPGRPDGVPTNAEIQAYAREKWPDDDRALNWAVSFHAFWNDPKRNWQRQGRTIDWPIEFGEQVARWRSA